MTTKGKKYPIRVKIKQNNQSGWVVMDQIRTIDRLRVVKILGELKEKETLECKQVIKETFVD